MKKIDLDDFVCIGEALGPHGVNGALWIRFFTSDIRQVLTFKELFDENQNRFGVTLKVSSKTESIVKANIEGLKTRNDAESFRGKLLYVKKTSLAPLEEEEFYYADLIGLKVQNLDGISLGPVVAVHNFGAQDILEIKVSRIDKTVYVPFLKSAVPSIDLTQGLVVIDDAYLKIDDAYQELFEPKAEKGEK